MLTKAQILKRFDCEAFDASEILKIQATGRRHGKLGVVFKNAADFADTIGMDIEHIESIAMLDKGSVRAVYDAAVREGQRSAPKKQKAA